MKRHWDVIVAGGGPAGIFAAREAAARGSSVLLLERKQEMGVPVRCGEAVGAKDLASYVDIDPRWISSEINTFILVLPNGKEVKLKNNMYTGYILNRDLFEYDMAADAAKKGAVIRMKSNVLELLPGKDASPAGVRVDENGRICEHYARVVIAADGVESRIARGAGIHTALKPGDIEPCVQVTASNVHLPEKALYLYVGFCYAPGGYAWAFPKDKGCANIGLGINGAYSRSEKPAAAYFEDFLQRFFPDISVQRYVAGGVPVTTNLHPLAKDELLIAGDAGRMVNPLNGGGITHAIYSGIEAGRAAAQSCSDPAGMPGYFNTYQKNIQRRFGRNHEHQYRIKEIVYQMSDEDYNRIGEEVLKIDVKKRSFLSVFRHVVRQRPAFLTDVLRAFSGI